MSDSPLPDGTIITLDHLTRVQLHPDDILVCTVPRQLAEWERREICEQLATIAPNNEAVLLDSGITLAALRPVTKPQ